MVDTWLLVAFGACVLLLGFAARLVFDRWKVPDFLLLLAGGLVLGPAGVNLLPADVRAGIDGAAPLFLAVTVAFLMMEAGMQFSIKGGRVTVLLIVMHTSMAAALTFALAWVLIVYLFGLSPLTATVLAAATLGPSAVVLASFAPRLAISDRTRRALLFEGVIANVLAFFLVMSVPNIGVGPFGPPQVAGAISSLILAVLMAGGVAVAWSFVVQRLHPREGSFIATLAVALAVYALASGPLFGNGAVAAFAFGAVLRRAGGIDPQRAPAGGVATGAADLGRFHSEASFLVRTFFFLYLGLLFAPANLTPVGVALALSLVILFVAARYPSSLVLKRAWRLSRADTLVLVGSVSRGLTDILIVLYGISAGLVPASEAGMLAGVIVFLLLASLLANGAMILFAERLRRADSATERALMEMP